MIVSEKVSRRVDSYGRVSLPKSLRSKFEMNEGVEVEFFTMYEGNKAYVCLAVKEDSNEKAE